jgi:hypothetical protein
MLVMSDRNTCHKNSIDCSERIIYLCFAAIKAGGSLLKKRAENKE